MNKTLVPCVRGSLRNHLAIIFSAALLASACVERAPEMTAAEREQVRTYISTEAPSPQHELDINFDNRVRLVGYDIDVETITPGQAFTITWYWRCERSLGGDWQIFTHLADATDENRQNADADGALRGIYQPHRWREGEYIRDPQQLTLPTDWRSDAVVFYLGLWSEDRRMGVTHGPNDGNDRARAARIPVRGGPAALAPTPAPAAGERAEVAAPRPVSGAIATRATESISVDGRLAEPVWTAATPTNFFVNTMTGGEAELRAAARLVWDDTNLYVGFDVGDDHLENSITERDGHLWEQDCVEIMIDPDGDGRHYYEMQVSPTGNVFDTRYDTRRSPEPFGHMDWDSHLSARVSARGTVNDANPDEGYTVEIAIPWSSFTTADGAPLSAPPEGAAWRVNFYVMDRRPTGDMRFAAWSPPLEGDFHVPARFGRVVMGPGPAQVPAVIPGGTATREVDPAIVRGTPRAVLPPGAARALKRAMAGERELPVGAGVAPPRQ